MSRSWRIGAVSVTTRVHRVRPIAERVAAVQRDAGPHEIAAIARAPSSVPAELPIEVGAGGSRRRRRSKRASCSAFSGCSGSSAHARCVMTKSSASVGEHILAHRERADVAGTQARAGSCRCRGAAARGRGRASARPARGCSARAARRARRARQRCSRARPRTRRSRHRSERAQLARFGGRRDEEAPATFAQQAAHDALDAETVRVGLDDGGAFGRRGALAQQPVVARQRIEIDAQRRRASRSTLSRHTAADPL